MRRLAPAGHELWAFPMVGDGLPYRSLGVPCLGPAQQLPSEGFGLLERKAFAKDLAHGLLGTAFAQLRAARAERGKVDLAVAIGDIVPLAAALLTGAPVVFVGCAKSDYYEGLFGYNRLELRLMARARIVFPRDAATAVRLREEGLPVPPVGTETAWNALLDDLDGDAPLEDPPESPVVAVLPGSRRDAPERVLDCLDVLEALARSKGPASRAAFLFAMAPSISKEAVREALCARADVAFDGLRARSPKLPRDVRFAWGSFGEILNVSDLALGIAGSANEQALARGVPLVTFPTRGPYGEGYVKMKAQLFGSAARTVFGGPAAVAGQVDRLLASPGERLAMAAEGRRRMGTPGASDRIASALRGLLAESGR